MSNIDTSGTRFWGQAKPPRSSLTQIASQIKQIRDWHSDEFRRTVRTSNSAIQALRLRAAEDQAIRSALYRHGWTYGTLAAELERRTTARWARYVIHGWF